MPVVQRFRLRKDHAFIVEALRYGTYTSEWGMDSVAEIVKFVLGLDVDAHTTVANERALDVVRPVIATWDPDGGAADIEVYHQTHDGRQLRNRMSLGEWIVRYSNGNLSFVDPTQFRELYEDVPDEVVQDTELIELTDIIYEHSAGGSRVIAERIARALLDSGWARN